MHDGSAPAYSDAEKGFIDIHAPHPTATVPSFETAKALTYPDEKKVDPSAPSLFPPPKEKKDTPAAPPVKAAPKKKKKVSRWILWKLWFNTYR